MAGLKPAAVRGNIQSRVTGIQSMPALSITYNNNDDLKRVRAMSENVSIGNIEINQAGGLGGFLKSLGVARVAAMATVAVGMIGFFIFLIMRFQEPQMTVLFSDLEFKDSVEIVKKLEGMNVQHEVRGDGAVILVPNERVLKLRLAMAEEGLPAGGTIGYEIFDKGNTLGATNFVQNINQLRAIEGELSRTIKALNQVSHARVHLVLPKRKLFARDKARASASIVIKSRGDLDRGQIRAIQHLVAAAVEDLTPSQVAVVDENGRLLAKGAGDAKSGDPLAEEITERTRSYEFRLTRELEEIVGRVVGDGHVRVRVNAEMDFNRVTKVSEVYDPEGRVVRSSNTREESTSSKQPTGDKSVTVGNDLPDSNADKNADGSTTENQQKTEEIVNYEISKTNQTEIIEAGRVKRLSVAVLVDGVYAKGADGNSTYTPRQQAELDQIAALVRSAIGFNENRGDVVNITNLRFAEAENLKLDEADAGSFFNLGKADYFYIAELLVTLLISVFFIAFVIRPLVKRVLEPEKNDIVIDLAAAVEEKKPQENTPLDLDAEKLRSLEEVETQMRENKTAKNIEDAKASGQIHAAAIKQIGNLVENNPREATSVIRNWINEPEQSAA